MPGSERSQSLRANALFKHALCPIRMQALARGVRFVERQRMVDASSVFWALMVALGGNTAQYLSDVLRTLNCQQSWALRYKPFWNRLSKPAFARFMRETFRRLCSELVARVVSRRLKGAAGYFSDIFIDDGSSLGLADGLKDVFPGRFTRIRPATVELHAHMSLFRDQLVSVKLAPDTQGEREFLPKPEELPPRSLSLRDRGYIDFRYFERLQKTEAFLICRARNNHNPIVVEMRGVPRALARRWRGKRLAQVPRAHLKAATDILITYDETSGNVPLRLIVRQLPKSKRRPPRHPRKQQPKPRPSWLYLVTNLPDQFTADDIQHFYRLRWQIELVFKDWKSYANLRRFPSENPAIVEGLIWASLCAAFIKRALAHWAQLVYGRPISTRAAAQAGAQLVAGLASWAMQRAPLPELVRLLSFLANTATRAHPRRDKLRPQELVGLRLACG